MRPLALQSPLCVRGMAKKAPTKKGKYQGPFIDVRRKPPKFAKRKSNGRVMVMNRAYRGLYGGIHIQFGNQISFSHRK